MNKLDFTLSSSPEVVTREEVEGFLKMYGENRAISGQYDYFWNRGSPVVVVARALDRTIGMSGMNIRDGRAVYLWTAVMPEFRKHGVASALIAARTALADQKGAAFSLALVRHTSPICHTLEKQGFQRLQRVNGRRTRMEILVRLHPLVDKMILNWRREM